LKVLDHFLQANEISIRLFHHFEQHFVSLFPVEAIKPNIVSHH